jgi:hypothetical protein
MEAEESPRDPASGPAEDLAPGDDWLDAKRGEDSGASADPGVPSDACTDPDVDSPGESGISPIRGRYALCLTPDDAN